MARSERCLPAREDAFEIDSAIALYGGYAGYGAPDPNERNVALYETILSGDLLGDDGPDPLLRFIECVSGVDVPYGLGCAEFDSSGDGDVDEYDFRDWWNSHNGDDNSDSVVSLMNASDDVVLDGFTISGARRWSGVRAYTDFNGTIANCTISNNWGQDGGGAIALLTGNPTITNCAFLANYSDGQGAVWPWGGVARLTNCVFRTNRGGFLPGSASLTATLTNCSFFGNKESPAVENRGGEMTLVNCTMAGNSAYVEGAVHSTGATDVTNCILWANTPEEVSYYGPAPTVTYSCVRDGTGEPWFGTGCIDADPLLVDAKFPHLQANSPCIDAGDNTAVPPDKADLDYNYNTTERTPVDLAGDPRFADDPNTADTGVADPPDYIFVVDMGAYEYSDLDGDGFGSYLDNCPGHWNPGQEDCDNDGKGDLCTILECPPGGVDPDCDDCNNNDIPDNCDIMDGTSRDFNSDRIPDECQIIPTLSEWGLVILTLLLLAASKIYFGRRRPVKE